MKPLVNSLSRTLATTWTRSPSCAAPALRSAASAASSSFPPRSPSHSRRAFFSGGGPDPLSVSAHSVLPFRRAELFGLVADVDSYHRFFPYLARSAVSHWSGPDGAGRRWPARAALVARWKGIEEEYVSRVYCSPAAGVVEAVAGAAESRLSPAEAPHHYLFGARGGPEVVCSLDGDVVEAGGPDDPAGRGGRSSVISDLTTRWSFAELGPDRTEVKLEVLFTFSNPLFTLIAGQIIPEISSLMIRAFEAHAKLTLGKGTGTGEEVKREK